MGTAGPSVVGRGWCQRRPCTPPEPRWLAAIRSSLDSHFLMVGGHHRETEPSCRSWMAALQDDSKRWGAARFEVWADSCPAGVHQPANAHAHPATAPSRTSNPVAFPTRLPRDSAPARLTAWKLGGIPASRLCTDLAPSCRGACTSASVCSSAPFPSPHLPRLRCAMGFGSFQSATSPPPRAVGPGTR